MQFTYAVKSGVGTQLVFDLHTGAVSVEAATRGESFSFDGREIPAEWYEVPAFYRSVGDTVIGPDVELPWPSYTRQLDHELELAAVIGRRVKDVAPEDAAEYDDLKPLVRRLMQQARQDEGEGFAQ